MSISVLPHYILDQDIPSSVSSEHMLDEWLADKVVGQPSHTQGEYTLFLTGVDEMVRASEGGRRVQDRIVMGLRRHGWVAVPDSAFEGDKKLKSR